jgi:hypothetical protein
MVGGPELRRWYAADVPMITLAALLVARPNGPFWGRPWVEDVLAKTLRGYDEPLGSPRRLLGWSIGGVVGPETFVQSRPVLRSKGQNPIDDLLRTPAGCTVAVFASGDQGDDEATPRDVVRIARFRRWVSVHRGEALSEKTRRALYAHLPDFLSRDPQSRTDAELLLRSALANLHEAGGFGKAYADADAMRRAVRRLGQDLGDEAPTNMFLADGRTLVILNRNGALLAFEPPQEMWPTRSFRLDGQAMEGAPASLLVWTDAEAPPQPIEGAERLAPGILSVQAPAPSLLVRDA